MTNDVTLSNISVSLINDSDDLNSTVAAEALESTDYSSYSSSDQFYLYSSCEIAPNLSEIIRNTR